MKEKVIEQPEVLSLTIIVYAIKTIFIEYST